MSNKSRTYAGLHWPFDILKYHIRLSQSPVFTDNYLPKDSSDCCFKPPHTATRSNFQNTTNTLQNTIGKSMGVKVTVKVLLLQQGNTWLIFAQKILERGPCVPQYSGRHPFQFVAIWPMGEIPPWSQIGQLINSEQSTRCLSCWCYNVIAICIIIYVLFKNLILQTLYTQVSLNPWIACLNSPPAVHRQGKLHMHKYKIKQ